jgi:hypothetical protein
VPGNFVVVTLASRCKRTANPKGIEGLLKLRDAALQLAISFPTIKQWIYKKKIRSNRTAGGHQSRRAKWIDCFSEPAARPSNNAKEEIRRVSRNRAPRQAEERRQQRNAPVYRLKQPIEEQRHGDKAYGLEEFGCETQPK